MINREDKDKFVRNIRRKYLFVLGILAFFEIFSYLLFLYSKQATGDEGYLINLSGKQRYLSQRIALYASKFVQNKDTIMHELYHKELDTAIIEMENAHNLLKSDTSSITKLYHSPKIDSIYYKGPVYLDLKVLKFLQEAHLISGEQEDKLSIDNPHLKYLLTSSNDILPFLDLIVSQYQKENKDETIKNFIRKTIMTIVFLLTYLLIGLFIFRPMTNQIYQNLSDIEINQNEIERMNKIHFGAIIDAQEKERKRIASDLHDGLIQSLTTLMYKFDIAEKELNLSNNKIFNDAKLITNNVITETKNIAYSILPPLLKEFGVIPALKSLAEQVRVQSKINILVQTYGYNQRLADNIELTLYRISQEALNNIVKYAKSKNVKIQLIQHTGTIVLIIEDDGKGFDTTKKYEGIGLGLINIKERINALNGIFIINSTLNIGTEIMVEIPLNDNNKA